MLARCRVYPVLLAAALLTACATAPQQAVSLGQGALGATSGKIAVAMTPLPKVDTQFPGAGCLLCLAVASAANSSLTDHTRTLPLEDLPDLKKLAAAAIAKKGASVVVIDDAFQIDALEKFSTETPNFARKDFRPLREKYKVDRLLVIEVSVLGIWRNYASYVPTGDPTAILRGVGYLVDLRTNGLEWYEPVNIVKGAAVWDQPPKFPDLTNAYFQALELGKDAFIKPLTR